MAEETVYFSKLEEDYIHMLAGAANGDGPQGSTAYQRNAAHVAMKNAAYAAKAVLTQTKNRDLWLAAMDAWNVRAERHLRMVELVRL